MNITFGGIRVIKTPKANVLNSLYDSTWDKKTRIYYDHMGISSPDKDGFHRGIILNGKHKRFMDRLDKLETNSKNISPVTTLLNTVNFRLYCIRAFANSVKETLVENIEDLRKLPELKGIKIEEV